MVENFFSYTKAHKTVTASQKVSNFTRGNSAKYAFVPADSDVQLSMNICMQINQEHYLQQMPHFKNGHAVEGLIVERIVRFISKYRWRAC